MQNAKFRFFAESSHSFSGNFQIVSDRKRPLAEQSLYAPSAGENLINLGNVKKVVYRNSYRKKDAVSVLEFVGVKVHQFGE